MIEPQLCCYRLDSVMPYDEEAVWAMVQQYGGMLSIRCDCIDFWIPRQYESFLVLKYQLMRRKPELDYV